MKSYVPFGITRLYENYVCDCFGETGRENSTGRDWGWGLQILAGCNRNASCAQAYLRRIDLLIFKSDYEASLCRI